MFVAGDDDQCIYRFRHADPSGIREFPTVYPESTDYVLDRCYRCGESILDAALALIRHEDGRLDKNIHADRPGGTVKVFSFASPNRQRAAVGNLVAKHIAGGTTPDQILILVPRRDRAQGYVDAIHGHGIRTENAANREEVLDNPLVRRFAYAIRYALDAADALALRGWLALTPRIGVGTLSQLIERCLDQDIVLRNACALSSVPRVRRSLEELEQLASRLADQATREETLKTIIGEDGLSDTAVETLSQLAESLDRLDSAANSPEEQTHEADNDQGSADTDDAAVRVMTLYGAKGLTADVVIVTDLDDTLIPADKDVDEQRRLFYVSMTRARQFLYLTHVTTRWDRTRYAGVGHRSSGAYRTRSRFLDEVGIPSSAFDG